LTETVASACTVNAATITLNAKDSIVLKTGGATITMKSGGDIDIKGSNITAKADGPMVLKGSKIGEN